MMQRKNVKVQLTDPLNIIIRALNQYIEENPYKLLNNESGRCDNVCKIATKIYRGFTSAYAKFANESDASEHIKKNYLTYESLYAYPKKLLPEIQKSDLASLTIYQILERTESTYQAIEKILNQLTTGFWGSSSLASSIKLAIDESAALLEKLEKQLESNKESDKKIAERNHQYNLEQPQDPFFSLFLKLPAEIQGEVKGWLSNYSAKDSMDLTNISRVSQKYRLFANTIGKSEWVKRISMEFELTSAEIEDIKKNNESYCGLYKRIRSINYLCNTIREFAWDIKQLGGSVADFAEANQGKKNLLKGLALGVEALNQKLESLRNQKEELASKINAKNDVYMWIPR